MADKPIDGSEWITAPVSLRSDDGDRVFLAGYEIMLLDGIAGPIVHEGRRYVFSRALPAVWGPGLAANEQLIYVFDELDTDSLDRAGPGGSAESAANLNRRGRGLDSSV